MHTRTAQFNAANGSLPSQLMLKEFACVHRFLNIFHVPGRSQLLVPPPYASWLSADSQFCCHSSGKLDLQAAIIAGSAFGSNCWSPSLPWCLFCVFPMTLWQYIDATTKAMPHLQVVHNVCFETHAYHCVGMVLQLHLQRTCAADCWLLMTYHDRRPHFQVLHLRP